MKICILGGTGFVGRSLINALSKENYTFTVITRDFDKNKDLAIYPNLKLIQEDIYKSYKELLVWVFIMKKECWKFQNLMMF